MEDAVELRMREAAVPLCQEFIGTAFGLIDTIDPYWKEGGIDLYSSKLLFATVLFNFASIPVVLTSRTAYQRLSKPVADKLTSVVIRLYVPPLVDLLLEKAEITESDAPQMFREDLKDVLKEHALTYADDDD